MYAVLLAIVLGQIPAQELISQDWYFKEDGADGFMTFQPLSLKKPDIGRISIVKLKQKDNGEPAPVSGAWRGAYTLNWDRAKTEDVLEVHVGFTQAMNPQSDWNWDFNLYGEPKGAILEIGLRDGRVESPIAISVKRTFFVDKTGKEVTKTEGLGLIAALKGESNVRTTRGGDHFRAGTAFKAYSKTNMNWTGAFPSGIVRNMGRVKPLTQNDDPNKVSNIPNAYLNWTEEGQGVCSGIFFKSDGYKQAGTVWIFQRPYGYRGTFQFFSEVGVHLTDTLNCKIDLTHQYEAKDAGEGVVWATVQSFKPTKITFQLQIPQNAFPSDQLTIYATSPHNPFDLNLKTFTSKETDFPFAVIKSDPPPGFKFNQ